MRSSDRLNTEQTKEVARKKYAERQFSKWIKWRWDNFGYIPFDELVKQCKKYKI